MILVELQIENYKHFLGSHAISVPSEGIVGVIGANGAGKTTLFEAIEWCLYNPAHIASKDVPPRLGLGQSRVQVTLEDPRSGYLYVVERTLKRKVISAEIYRTDQPELRIVNGTKQVSDYVARRLIGLSHRAFVSTFFTRQKELSFFGDLTVTERRVEVGRLLGFETIRAAQQSIGEERSQARAEAAALRAQHAEATAGRDFAAETAAATAEVTERAAAVDTAADRLEDASVALLAARSSLEEQRERERKDAELALAVESLAGDERAVAARGDAARAELTRLDVAAETRASLVPLVATEAELSASVDEWARERDRYNRQRQLEADLARIAQSHRAIERGQSDTVAAPGLTASEVDGWRWNASEAVNLVVTAERLLAVATSIDSVTACAQAEALASCQLLFTELAGKQRSVSDYRDLHEKLKRERSDLLGEGDPDTLLGQATAERERALTEGQRATTQAAEVERKLEGFLTIVG
nr:AAA family ATPase [Chloroflexia bacterium]